MGKYNIRIDTENCTGCLRCQLACSESITGSFNPVAANIRVERSGKDCSIRFKETCNACGICADNCLYNALQKEPKESEK
jgi:ferredoxin